MRDLMAENPELGQKIAAEVERGNELDERGDAKKACQIYLKAWEQLPEPKDEWDLLSQWIADSMFNSNMMSAEYSDTKEWRSSLTHRGRVRLKRRA